MIDDLVCGYWSFCSCKEIDDDCAGLRISHLPFPMRGGLRGVRDVSLDPVS